MLCADPASSRQADQWTDQETLLLLEGIELYNENWDQIADHVGSKSKEQCLLHFIRLPVEDSFIEENFAHIDGSAKPTASSIPVKEESNSQSNGIHTNLPKKKKEKKSLLFCRLGGTSNCQQSNTVLFEFKPADDDGSFFSVFCEPNCCRSCRTRSSRISHQQKRGKK